MPNVSAETADQRITEGPVESFAADLDGGYTVNFACFRADMDHARCSKERPTTAANARTGATCSRGS